MMTIIFSIALAIVALGTALHALLSKRNSNSALAWVGVCLVLPLLGPIIYAIFGVNRFTQKAQRIYLARSEEDSSVSISEPPGTQLRPLSLVGEQVTGFGLLSCDEVQILENGEALYPAMLADINSAREKVYCSTYIFRNDKTGKELVAAFSEAQARGVDVRIIVDGLGAVAYPPRISRSLAGHSLNFKLFNPISLLPPSLHINMRNHRKLLLIDNDAVFTGGQNISSDHLASDIKNSKRTQDLHFRLRGKIVDEFERAFLKDWSHCLGGSVPAPFTPRNANCTESDIWTRLILDGPNENLDKLNEVLVGILSSAKNRIWIMTPYFLPGMDLVGALVGARLRGIDVKILLPKRTNTYLTHWATQHNLLYILDKGLEVFLQPAPFIHTKAIVIDEQYALIGSANLDPRSLRLNFELGVEIFNTGFNRDLAAYFEAKLDASSLLTLEKLKTRSALTRVRDAIAWLFSPYL